MTTFADPNDIRARFCRAMSEMYRQEVPLYGDLVDLVETTNAAAIAADPALRTRLEATDGLERISEERHGAIRLGTAEELHTMCRLFVVMGMHPVGYYDLSVAGIPVHSTAFRPVDADALKHSPFRVFTSLLRSELISDPELRAEAEAILADRDIFTPLARQLIDKHEAEGGLSLEDAERFIEEALETFRWHADARVSASTYQRLHDAHRLVADVVSFRGPHINHLTPRTLDIDQVQADMPARGITPKAVIEGPPPRQCPVLLRQTSFKALEEEIAFAGDDTRGKHTARFGEIEQRGIALTRKGRALYDELLDRARGLAQPKADGSNAGDYMRALSDVFRPLPDDYAQLRDQGMAFFHYSPTGKPLDNRTGVTIDELIASGHVRFDPIVYEDFLPVSAAGIFQSNLGDNAAADRLAHSNQAAFEAALGRPVKDEFALYGDIEQKSLANTRAALGLA
ncbi:VOC family protein [Devosia sp. 1566]|uniref:2-oxoadipate dioxygenase/decarboxylase HglS n=1 Tax=Devosia sp. 1566 TaxID=2499144 RepID=UPI000FDC41B3|nr:VOC family protein [Devosia sp. 1566]